MSDALPPLTALRAFEAAARHLSFAQAADELNVTPAALSFQIKSLEEHLGQPLFHRLNRAVALTELGHSLSPGLSDGFDAIRQAWRSARRQLDDKSLTVTAGPAFTAKWLAPRLFTFAQRYPDIELRFIASLRIMDFGRDEIDLAIRFGEGQDEGLHNEPLCSEYITPMMTPALAQDYGTLDALRAAPLLHDDSISFLKPRSDWPRWFDLTGIDREGRSGARFSQADHAIDAALAGGGVVLGRSTLAASALKEGWLVAPFREALKPAASFRIVHQKGAENRPHMSAFLHWIRSEAAEMATITERFRDAALS
ncbi:transcriptional regulator GcvA [Primorskyibacter sp. S187A]|uniref:transcriptional regulator GcvA n=1 Tax=Primorskyibacter sp. S187A TaxID=3415130 RepID=UPI003C7AB3CD